MTERIANSPDTAATPPPTDDLDNGAVPEHDADAHTGRLGWRGRIGAIGWRYTLVVFAVEILIFWILAGDRFLTTNNLILTAQNVAVLTVIACGTTFVLITAGVDLSVGSVAILGEVVAAKTIIAAGANGVFDACLGILAGIAVGIARRHDQRRRRRLPQGPTAHRHPRHLADGLVRRPDHHRRSQRAEPHAQRPR